MTFLICLPGQEFSRPFLVSWSALLTRLVHDGHNVAMQTMEGSNVYYVRNAILGGNARGGIVQVPMGGKVEYDYILWIDSDTARYTLEHVYMLVNDKLPIVAGIYRHIDGTYSAVKMWDEEKFVATGDFPRMTGEDLSASETDLIEVSHCGMGFMLVARGVYEKVPYPWHFPIQKTIPLPEGTATDFTSEDTGFCLRAQEAGFPIHIDRRVTLGHEKRLTI